VTVADPAGERPLYLHEVIDIVGLGAWPYMEHTVQASGDEKVNFALQGTWYTMGITGRWSQVINLWDVPGGWDGWATAVDRLNLKRTENKALEGWWQEAFNHRSGGFDRLLLGAPGCPTTDELVAGGVRGSLFVHEITEVRPGAQLDYLAAVREVRVPLLAEYGHAITGLYEVAMNDTEVVTVWATDVESHVRLQRAISVTGGREPAAAGVTADPRLAEWATTARTHAVRWREELMTPHPAIPIGPGEPGEPA
jgi:hypothetical protein